MTTTETLARLRAAHEAQIDPRFFPWALSERYVRQAAVAAGVAGLDADDPRIDVEYVDGPLKFLRNHWVFVPHGDGGCEIDFYVEFEFRSRIFEKMIGALFHEAVSRMVGAFEKRADALYGLEAPSRPTA